MKKLINPIQEGKFNICPECLTPTLYLLEKNLDISYIDEHGNPLDHNNLSHDSILLCGKCKAKFDYKKMGNKILIYSDEDKEIDKAREVLISKGKLERYNFDIGDSDTKERDDWE